MSDMWPENTEQSLSVLDEANNLVSGDRQAVYSHPINNFTKIMTMAQPILESDIDPALKHALYMIQVKIARLLNTPDHHDSLVDIAGYCKTYQMVLDALDK
jgi:hypothetical protein